MPDEFIATIIETFDGIAQDVQQEANQWGGGEWTVAVLTALCQAGREHALWVTATSGGDSLHRLFRHERMGGNTSMRDPHLYHTSAYMTEVNKYSRGIVADRNRLYWEDFKQMPAPCPPPDEQCAIADYIDREANFTIDQIRMRQEQIRLAEEYRTRLIADVVTGKLDVRGTVPALPRQADVVVADLAEA